MNEKRFDTSLPTSQEALEEISIIKWLPVHLEQPNNFVFHVQLTDIQEYRTSDVSQIFSIQQGFPRVKVFPERRRVFLSFELKLDKVRDN